MKKLFPLFLLVLFLCWSLAVADISPVSSSPDAHKLISNKTDKMAAQASGELTPAPKASRLPESPIHNPAAALHKSSDTPQYPSPLVEVCPDSSLYGQVTHAPDDPWTAGTSDQQDLIRRYEYVFASGQICDLHWWGLSLYLDGNDVWQNCDTETMTFHIVFYEDVDGVPGDSLCSYDVTPTMTATGDLYNSTFPLYRFDVENLAPCCSISTAWIAIEGSSIGPTPDCWFLWMSSGVGDGISIVQDTTGAYVVDYDLSICVTGTYVPLFGACCNDNNGQCIENAEITQCPYPAARFAPNTLCANLYPPCGGDAGACCDDQGNCTQTLLGDCAYSWFYNTSCVPNVCPQAPPCTLSCAGTPEGEEDCYYNYDDTTNGGCNSDIPVFGTITVGDTICGTAGNYTYEVTQDSLGIARDTDWYELTVTSDAMLIYSGIAEFDLQLLIIEEYDCIVNPNIIAAATIPACSTGSISAIVVPGTYYLWAGENYENQMVECGSHYKVWAELTTAPTGACCVNTVCVATNLLSECNALQGNWYVGEDCNDFTCPVIVDCDGAVWSNGSYGVANLYATQCDHYYPMAAGVADDFVLPGTQSLDINYVAAWVGFWQPSGSPNPVSTPAELEAVNVTIYNNNPANNSPGGKPRHPPDATCAHIELITDGIVYTTQLAAGSFGYLADDTGIWRLMMPVSVTLDAGVTYWLEVEPVLGPYDPYGQSGWVESETQYGEGAMQIFELLGTLVWTAIDPDPTDMAFCLLSPDWPTTGRCCYGSSCVDTTLEACNTLGGTWIDTLNCTDDPCPQGCTYIPGDVNGVAGYNGLDITYGVTYFKGGPAPHCPFGSCPLPPCDAFYYCGTVNGDCSFNGLDITYGVAYFKGGPGPVPCAQCPPTP